MFPFFVVGCMGWIDDNTFEFFMPAQAIILSKGKNGADKEGRRWIQGIASTRARDLQGEIVEQKGIDFSYFISEGYFNWDHKEGPYDRVGEPTECKLTKNGLWVKGFLWNNKKRADEIWEMMNSLISSGSRRKMGFSIQGKIKRRAGNVIKECWIQEVAITACPVNTTTWAEIAKSLSAQKWDFSKSYDEDEEKALSAGNSPLVPESLEGKKKVVRTLDKSLTFLESVAWIQSTTGMSQTAAEATARTIFSVLTKE